MAENTDVVVIGGGYAGVMAANRLTQRDDVTVTLINPRPSFVERIRPHQLVGGSHDAVVGYRKVLGKGVPRRTWPRTQASRRPIISADKVARFIIGGANKADATLTSDPTAVGGNPALVLRLDGEIDGVLAIRVEDARITGLYYVRNPEKLTRVESETPFTLRSTPRSAVISSGDAAL